MKTLWILGTLLLTSLYTCEGAPVENGTEGPTEPQSCYEGENFQCGSVITENGTIMHYNSENASQVYPNENCTWTIRAPEGTYIELENLCMLPLDTDNNTCKPCFEEDVLSDYVTHSRSCPFWMLGSSTNYAKEVNITISFWQDVDDDGDLEQQPPTCYGKEWSFSLKAKFLGDEDYVATTPKPTTTPKSTTTAALEKTTSSAQIVYLSMLLNLLCLFMTMSFY